MRIIIWALIFAGTMMPCLADADMYRWVDQNNLVHYGDRVPPQYAKGQREVIDDQGRIVNVMKREATADEIAAAEKKHQQALAAQALAAHEAQYNRSLTDTYTNVKQLDAAYRDRIAIVDAKIESTGKTRAEIRAKLDPLYLRAKDKQPEPGLDKRIKQGQARLQGQDAIIESLRGDKKQIEQRYQSDRQRYLSLTTKGN